MREHCFLWYTCKNEQNSMLTGIQTVIRAMNYYSLALAPQKWITQCTQNGCTASRNFSFEIVDLICYRNEDWSGWWSFSMITHPSTFGAFSSNSYIAYPDTDPEIEPVYTRLGHHFSYHITTNDIVCDAEYDQNSVHFDR